uniref:BTB domain-containing protein n=1 Tax=Panagrolaimus sp. ES5 TaxID=591445 RepID=A0AC34FXV8_9BILA
MAVNTKFSELQQIKFDNFTSQNPENGQFDVIFEIKGKKIYTHKTMLTLVSDTFKSMLSENWTSKDEPIPLQNYSYEDFYEFLTFLYSAQCQLKCENIFVLVDMAEFYNVALFKDFSEEYLLKMTFTSENYFALMELAEKYSLKKLKIIVQSFVLNNFSDLENYNDFVKISKFVVEEIVKANKDKAKPEDLFQFVIPRGFIFSSLEELSKILSNNYFLKTKVKVTNSIGQTMHGNLATFNKTIIDKNIIDKIRTSDLSIDSRWGVRFKVPPSSIPTPKVYDFAWYLIHLPTETKWILSLAF